MRVAKQLSLGAVLAAVLIGAACSDDAATAIGPAQTGGAAAVSSNPAGADAAPAADSGVVQVAGGSLQGDVLDGLPVRRFLKIPYAKPPLGALRWMPPQKPEPWSGVRHEP